MTLLKTVINLSEPIRGVSDKFASPVLDLGIRLFVASIFFKSGWQKFKNFLNDDWGTTVYLFEEVHIVPFIPPEIAAFMGTATEVILPVLLVVGLFSRLSALGLLLTTVLIEFFVTDAFGDSLSNADHYLWMLLLAIPLIKGSGVLSLDALAVKFLRK